MIEKPEIIATYLDVDGQVSGTRAEVIVERANAQGLQSEWLKIQPLSAGWDAEPEGTFKSGAAPVFALKEAVRLLGTGTDVVVISGKDFLRTEYSSADRARLMAVFDGATVAELYTELADEFMRRHGISEDCFLELARALEANYRKTAVRRGLEISPAGTRDRMVTRLFRLVDCANPVIDFEGEVVLATPQAAARLGMVGVQVVAVSTAEVPDGPAHIVELAGYAHLEKVLAEIGQTVDLAQIIADPSAALEIYTCFPVVPMAFMIAAGWAKTPAEMLAILAQREITTSGGMNFARAPWNNPSLQGLILVARAIENGSPVGLLHSNGGLGGRQAVAVLRRS